MTVISVDLTNAPYDIHVRAGLMAQAPEYLLPYARDNRLLVVTDENVARAVWPNKTYAFTVVNLFAKWQEQIVDRYLFKFCNASCGICTA